MNLDQIDQEVRIRLLEKTNEKIERTLTKLDEKIDNRFDKLQQSMQNQFYWVLGTVLTMVIATIALVASINFH